MNIEINERIQIKWQSSSAKNMKQHEILVS